MTTPSHASKPPNPKRTPPAVADRNVPGADADAALVHQLVEAISATLTAEDVARVAVAQCVALLGAVRGSLTLLDDEAGVLELVGPAGYGDAGPPHLVFPAEASNPVGVAYRTRRPVIMRSRAEYERLYPGFARQRVPADPAAPSYAVLPLEVPGAGVVGTLNIVFDGTNPAERLPLLREFARVVAQAADRARLFASERRARLQADALVQVSAALSAAPTVHELARVVMEEGCRALGSPAGYLVGLNAEGDGLELLGSVGFPETVTRRWHAMPLDMQLPLAEVVRTGAPIWLETAEDAARYPLGAEARAMSGYLAALVVPLVLEGRSIGAVSFHFSGERRFTRSERGLAVALAGLAAHAFERARLFDAADRARRTTEAVVEHIPVGVSVAEAPSGRVIYMNEAVARIWRGERSRPDSLAAYPSWATAVMDGRPLEPSDYPMARALRGEEVCEAQLRIERADGTVGFIQVSSSPIRDEAGAIIAGVSAIVDVTERVQSEALREAFMGLLSHELRTPVTSILAAAKLLATQKANRPAEVRNELVADMEVEADRLHRLVENVLVIARVERGIELEEGEPILLQHLVPRIVAEERRRWPEAKIEVSVAHRLPTVLGEPGYVAQILSNLISNGIKYSPRGAELLVTVGRQGAEVVVRVLDRGIGIDDEEPERLFEAFYRASQGVGRAPGAGIGLFVVRQLVEAMHGRAWACARSGGGSEFGFALPVLEA